MNLSEFIQRLGTDPGSQDPEFLRARTSSPEFIETAACWDRFERKLNHALTVKQPEKLLRDLAAVAESPATRSIWRHYAVAAGVLLIVALAGLTWRMTVIERSVGAYVAEHYAFDGSELLARGEGQIAENIADVMGTFRAGLTPEFAASVSFIKFCQTPEGLGAHLIVKTPTGPVTVLYMPSLKVDDGETLEFDGMRAQLVRVSGGAAAIIGTPTQQVDSYYALVQNAFVTLEDGA